MRKTMKQVLSILTVFVVLLGMFLVPVHAEEGKTVRESVRKNNPNNTENYLVMGGLKKTDEVYAIRLVDTYTNGDKLVRYETKEWVKKAVEGRDPIFGKDDAIVSISETDLKKISEIADSTYENLKTAINDHEEDVFELTVTEHGSRRYGKLPWGLYLVKVKTEDGRTFGPAILGVNPDNNNDLNLSKKYNGETELKGEEIKLRKSFYFEENGEPIYKSSYSPFADEVVTFMIDGIYIPNFSNDEIKKDNFIVEIKDIFDLDVYEIVDDPDLMVHKDGSEYRTENVEPCTMTYAGGLDDYNSSIDGNYYYCKDNNRGFALHLTGARLEKCKGNFISLKYTAKLKGDNKPSEEYFKKYVNSVTTTISQKNKPEPEVETAEATAYVGKIPFLKYDQDLYLTECADDASSDVRHSVAKLEGANFILTDNIFGSSDMEKDVSSDKNGIVTLSGVTIDMKEDKIDLNSFDVDKDLDVGTVYLYETQAPDGYTTSQNRYKIMSNGYQTPEGTLEFVMNVYNMDNLKEPIVTITNESEIEQTEGFWQFPNSKNPYLPTTGSKTMMILTMIGVGLVTGVTVVSRKKKHASSMN